MISALDEVDLYAVVSTAGLGRDPASVLEEILSTRIRMIQLRGKNLSRMELYRLALVFREKTAAAGRILIINNEVDVALASGADGVHLGNDDLPLGAARKIAPDLIIGKSTHSLKEALSAAGEGASYINVGPVFSTPTKPGMRAVGLETFKEIKKNIDIPVTVMGGINRDNLAEVRMAGADKIAMVRGIAGGNIRKDVEELYRIYDSCGPV